MYSFSKRLAAMKKLGLVWVKVVYVNDGGGKSELLSDSEIEVKDDAGFLAACDSHRRIPFGLIVSTKRGCPVYVVWTEGAARMIRTLGDWTKSDDDVATFIKRIPTLPIRSGEYATKNSDHDNNGVWFISIAGGKLRMWEVAVVTDICDGYSYYYLSLQEVYKADLFNNGLVWIPPEQFSGYENWESLQLFLHGVVEIDSLRPASKYRARKAGKLAPLVGNQARILWFSQSRRYGLATLADGVTVRLHASKVREQEFPAFEPGEVVTFESLKTTPQGWDLLGVRAIV